MSDYDYIALGHVTVDVRADTGARSPGGSVLYSGLQAARLGLRTLIITAGDRDEIRRLLEPYADELDLLIQPRPHTTTFVTSGIGETRRQQLLAWAGELDQVDALAASIVHVAPVARETGRVAPVPGTFVGVTPQGLLRSWDPDGTPTHVALDSRRLPVRYDAIVLDRLERTYAAAIVRTDAQAGVVVAITAADDGVQLELIDGTLALPALAPAAVVEDLGAGDVFAAAFFVALHSGQEPVQAAMFGQAAACLRLGEAGPQAVPDRAAIEARLLAEPRRP